MNDANGTDLTKTDERTSSDNSSSLEDTNNMFTKFAFPFKLHSILESAGTAGQEAIISWLPSGKAFKIHKPKEFADAIMPQYFNQTKYRSFQRQLYIYGFDRIKDKSSNDYGAYFHELFIRGASDLCLDMQRKKIKGTGLSNEERRRNASTLRSKPKASSSQRQTQGIVSQESMLSESHGSSIESMYTDLSLRSLSEQIQHRIQGKVDPCEQWNSANAASVIESALRVQAIASRQNNLNALRNNNSGNNDAGVYPSLNKIDNTGRRCSLGFVRVGRRGSLVFEGDEVCFGNRKFFFTSEH